MGAQDLFTLRHDLSAELQSAFERLMLGNDVCTTASFGPQLPGADRADICNEHKETEDFVALERLDVDDDAS